MLLRWLSDLLTSASGLKCGTTEALRRLILSFSAAPMLGNTIGMRSTLIAWNCSTKLRQCAQRSRIAMVEYSLIRANLEDVDCSVWLDRTGSFPG